jgi:beta-ketodecanoyl-[acyl-carrier-protein] synthase
MSEIYLTGSGVFTPPYSISNEELVSSFNQYVDLNPQENLSHSSAEFIEKASGIKSRYVMEKSGILNPNRMRPYYPKRPDTEMCIQVEMALPAIREALEAANKSAKNIDVIICACASLQRSYPAVAIEIQHYLGAGGYAFDVNVACSSATFAIDIAYHMLKTGSANTILVVSPELCSSHLNFKDRDSHFIFGDVATAVILERREVVSPEANAFEILGTYLKTSFSNNIRNNDGIINATEDEHDTPHIQFHYFTQQGKKVFKEVIPMVSEHIQTQVYNHHLLPNRIKRLWLHQANVNMNRLIAEKFYNRDISSLDAPIILDTYANTSSAGSIIAFHQTHQDFKTGDFGLICSFGGGYSVGSVLVKKS